MSSDSAEVCAILSALAPRVKSCKEALSALYGMQRMGKNVESSFPLNFLYDTIKIIAGNTLSFESVSCEELVSLSQQLVLMLSKLEIGLMDGYERWEMISLGLTAELVKRKRNDDPFFHEGNFRSNSERRMNSIAKKIFEDTSISISSNEYLSNIFESDLVLRIPITEISSFFSIRE